ncbi:hypothetical protein ACUXK4_004540 [Methylorubrum extorquens]
MGIALTSILGRALTAEEADGNIADLDGRVKRFEQEGLEARGIADVVYDDVGRTLTLTFNDGFEYEFPMPVAQLNLLGEWVSGVQYVRYDSVGHLGAWYACAAGHVAGASFDADLAAGKWVLTARAGRDAIRDRGTYAGAVTYDVYDSVLYTDGLIYQLLYAVPAGSPPGTTVNPAGFPPQVRIAAWALVNGAQRRAIRVWTDGKPAAGKTLHRELVDRYLYLRKGLPEAAGTLGTSAAASTTFTVTKNGSVVATLAFAAGSKVGFWTMAADVFAVPGDVLAVVAPATQDAAAADLTMVFSGTQT